MEATKNAPELSEATRTAIAVYRVKFNTERVRVLNVNGTKAHAAGMEDAREAFASACTHAAEQVTKNEATLGRDVGAPLETLPEMPRLTPEEYAQYQKRNAVHQRYCNERDRKAFRTANGALARALETRYAAVRAELPGFELTPAG